MRTAILLGGTGFLGRWTRRWLSAMGWKAVTVSRTLPAAGCRMDAAAPHIVADRNSTRAISQVVRRHPEAVVIDFLAFDLDATLPLIEALTGAVRRYVLVSSADVYRNYGGLHRLEDPEPVLTPLTEDSPLRNRLYPYRRRPGHRVPEHLPTWLDHYDKIPIEQKLLKQTDLPFVILRLPMVFGPGDRQRRFAWAIRPMVERRRTLEVNRGWASWRTAYGYVEDVAQGIAIAAVHDAAVNRIYNLGYREAPDHWHWIEHFAALLEWRGEVRLTEPGGAPLDNLSSHCPLNFIYPLVMDTSRVRQELGYTECTALSDALARTVEDELARGPS